MSGCKCFHWSRIGDLFQPGSEPFSLPAPLPEWPQGRGFADRTINLGELEVCQITKFEFIWACNVSGDRRKGFSFYKPVGIPDGFFSLGHYCQSNEKPFRGFVLAAREVPNSKLVNPSVPNSCQLPALQDPLDFTLIWSSDDGSEEDFYDCGYFWSLQPPEGYRAVGFVVTSKPEKPMSEGIKCVRADLTDECEAHRLLVKTASRFSQIPLEVWSTRPNNRGMLGKGVSTGTFFCSSIWSRGEELEISCLKNLDCNLNAMPNIDQIHALIRHYGPRLYLHPEEAYFPSSVSWFFENGALLYKKGDSFGQPVDARGDNLPAGGANDGEYWIDLPSDSQRESLKSGNLESAKLYVHVKPALGGTFTDIAMWVFCPFNGPGTLKLGLVSVAMTKIGEHVGDWEHFTLRISNFTGELWSIYFSQHSGGVWVDICHLEFFEGNKAMVYSSKHGHASFPHPGIFIQGSSRLGIGVRNDAARSEFYVDSSKQYEIIAAEYLGDGVISEPSWLQYMREWGPTIVYNSRNELDRLINRLPLMVRNSVENVFAKLPMELSGEEGPTGPKEKNNWVGDERW
ncbi:OLC1v1006924C1 [Oldenlandia corymbosa var. corymbosa]|uniref:OLC1v1006924C1 n=1 Tax=Oldenlandia corymbosa var. corymbosa TaxID=529605 RepID=A0AAV1DI57_OLDCO|nr:OLC1v1006924C1 [Oldenlandia corymbosa var. corymbosa]